MHHTVLSRKEQSAKTEVRTEAFIDFFDDSSLRYQTMHKEMQHVSQNDVLVTEMPPKLCGVLVHFVQQKSST
jgi:hypothetical protein